MRGKRVFLPGASDAGCDQSPDIFTLADFASQSRCDALICGSFHSGQNLIEPGAREYVCVSRLLDADGESGAEGIVETGIAGLVLEVGDQHGIAGAE